MRCKPCVKRHHRRFCRWLKLSSAGIMAALPTDFRPRRTCGTYDGKTEHLARRQMRKAKPSAPPLLVLVCFLPACIYQAKPDD